MENNEILELSTSAWREKVYIETAEFIIKGYVFKNCTLESKLVPQREIEKHDFLQVNISTILIIRPLNDD